MVKKELGSLRIKEKDVCQDKSQSMICQDEQVRTQMFMNGVLMTLCGIGLGITHLNVTQNMAVNIMSGIITLAGSILMGISLLNNKNNETEEEIIKE